MDGTRSDHAGALFEISLHEACKMRWERSQGALLNPEKNFTPGALARSWQRVENFQDKVFSDGPAAFQSVLSRTLNLPGNTAGIEPRFDGKVVIVTGASAGLGRCYVRIQRVLILLLCHTYADFNSSGS